MCTDNAPLVHDSRKHVTGAWEGTDAGVSTDTAKRTPLFEEHQKLGARMIPFYKNFVIHKDLYQVHGGFIGWTYEHLGIFSFSNELWNNDQLLGRSDPVGPGQTLARAVGATDQADQLSSSSW